MLYLYCLFSTGSLVAIANIATVCLVLLLRQRLWHHHGQRSAVGSDSQGPHHWWGAPPHYYHPNPIRALFCRRRCVPYTPRPPPADIITLATVHGDSMALRFSSPLYGVSSTPPPSYQQVSLSFVLLFQCLKFSFKMCGQEVLL